VRAILLLAGALGCGRLHFGAHADAGSGGDSVDALGPCLQWGPFGAPTLVPELSSAFDDWDPAISSDGLHAYTTFWVGPSGFTIAQHDRTATDQPFSTGTQLALQAGGDWILEPGISDDGNTLYVTYETFTPMALNIGTALRTGPMTFATAQVIPELQSTNQFTHEPWISTDGLRLYYATNNVPPDMSGYLELVVAERATPTSPFGAPKLLGGGVQSPMDDTSPGLSKDELEMFFASERTGGVGGYDIYRATRSDRTAAFDTIETLPALNSPMDDTGPELTADGSTLYYNYNTNRNGGANADIWVATRTCLAR
jgi:hypothetical protein